MSPTVLTSVAAATRLSLLLSKPNLKLTTILQSNKKHFSAAVSLDLQHAVCDPITDDSNMKAWQIHSYGGIEELRLSPSARRPIIKQPTDVLVEVSSSSVNPIDVAMLGGYGSVMLNTMRQMGSCSFAQPLEFPLTLGRDFCGRVVGKGLAVKGVRIGDGVWGTLPPHAQGCHAEYAVVNELLVHRKPVALNNMEAGSMLYAGVTAWSALKLTGGLYLSPARNKRVLVLGGSGGVGLMAVQMLKAWGAQVVATCQGDAVPMLESLNVDSVIDYTLPNSEKLIREEGKYDIILDCAGLGGDVAPGYADCLKDWSFSTFVTLKSPMLKNVDSYGLVGGMVKNAVDLLVPNVKTLQASRSSTVRWAFFAPLPEAIRDISTLVNEGKICPTIEKVFPFAELPSAYERVLQGHLRGKVVVTMETYSTEQEYKTSTA